jgi:hypothetical protein
VSLAPRAAAAQGQREDPAAQAALHLGPVAMTPKFALRDIGVDTNVLGQPESDADFTMTFAPGLDAWLRVGRVRLSSKSELEWQYFRENVGQRGFSLAETGTVELLLAYLTPYVSGTYDDTKRRQTAELDARVRQKTTGWTAGVTLYLGPRTDLDLQYRREHLRFGEDSDGLDPLASLDRDTETARVQAKYAITPLTRITTSFAQQRDRFLTSPFRDADSWSVVPGLEFKPSALVSGTVAVGYRTFDILDPTLPDFEGIVASVDLKYVARDMTKVEGLASRNVEYSFEPLQPFYVDSRWHVRLTQAVSYDWDVRGEAGRTTLDYGPIEGVPFSGRVDRIWMYGMGVGRRFATEVRVGLDVLRARRESDVPGRDYEGWRVGGSITYGY